ncbi:MAG: hypothetical protein EXQ85_09555 [Alphaproteobacteria bacterium]|nr:hypothetical protein [Alphaproteobacteria bacterium]
MRPNVSPFAREWTHIHLSGFESRQAHDAYQVSPLHDQIRDLMVPVIAAEVGDLEATRSP